MIQQTYNDVVTDDLIKGAIFNYAYPGFVADYAVLNCLLRKYNPKSVFEIGTSVGDGIRIIANALPEAKLYSLDLPFGEGDAPLYANGKDLTGANCKAPFTQIRGDSLTFDFSKYPCEAYFIDADHKYDNVLSETSSVLKNNPMLVIFHDSDIQEVMDAIIDASKMFTDYELYRVFSTRIAYLLRK